MTPCEAVGRLQRRQAETTERDRMPRHTGRPEHGMLELRPRLNDRSDQVLIGLLIAAECLRGTRQRPFDHASGLVVHRMRHHGRWLDPFETVVSQRQRPQERRSQRHGVNGRADVVNESWTRELGGAAAAARRRLRFVDDDAHPRTREHDGGGEPVGARSNDDGVCHDGG